MYQIWRIYLDLWGHDCKKWVWPTFGCKLGQSDPIVMQLKLGMPCHLLNVYTKFQIDISKHVEEKSGKRGRTDGHCHGIIRPFFKRAYKKTLNHCAEFISGNTKTYLHILSFLKTEIQHSLIIHGIDLQSSLWYKEHRISKLKCFSSRLAVVFAQSIEARC